MPVDPRKRQRKLERNRAKQKARRQDMIRREARSLAAQVKEAASAPILHCCVADDYWRCDLGNLLLSRNLGMRGVVFACFLIDRKCLGVKNAFVRLESRSYYDETYANLCHRFTMLPLPPESARKLVESAVRYAGDLGLPPHPDYHDAKHIFGNISAAASMEQYEFGQGGKPHFFAGPHDSPERCQDILATLHRHCGPGGYDFTVPSYVELPVWIDPQTVHKISPPHIAAERPALANDHVDKDC